MIDKLTAIEEVMSDLEGVPVILSQMVESFSLDKKDWSELDEWKMNEFHLNADQVINLSIKLIQKAIEDVESIISSEENDSDESEATTETTKNQK